MHFYYIQKNIPEREIINLWKGLEVALDKYVVERIRIGRSQPTSSGLLNCKSHQDVAVGNGFELSSYLNSLR